MIRKCFLMAAMVAILALSAGIATADITNRWYHENIGGQDFYVLFTGEGEPYFLALVRTDLGGGPEVRVGYWENTPAPGYITIQHVDGAFVLANDDKDLIYVSPSNLIFRAILDYPAH